MPATWIEPRPEGIHVPAGGFWIDPAVPRPRAIITHGHADHARSGHGEVIATPDTLAIMAARYGGQAGARPLPHGETVRLGDVDVLPVARQIAASTAGVPLRMSAIAAEGTLGSESDRPLLEKYSASSDARLRTAAQSALGRLAKGLPAPAGQP